MNNQEALDAIKNIKEYWTYKPTEVEAADLAIKALEKQIPKKPFPIVFVKHEQRYMGLCQICKKSIWEHTSYCEICGQKIEWIPPYE